MQVATVKVIGGPLLPRPQAGWTAAEADSFCEDFIRSNEIVARCGGLPGVDVRRSLSGCRADVVVSRNYSSSSLTSMCFDIRNI